MIYWIFCWWVVVTASHSILLYWEFGWKSFNLKINNKSIHFKTNYIFSLDHSLPSQNSYLIFKIKPQRDLRERSSLVQKHFKLHQEAQTLSYLCCQVSVFPAGAAFRLEGGSSVSTFPVSEEQHHRLAFDGEKKSFPNTPTDGDPPLSDERLRSLSYRSVCASQARVWKDIVGPWVTLSHRQLWSDARMVGFRLSSLRFYMNTLVGLPLPSWPVATLDDLLCILDNIHNPRLPSAPNEYQNSCSFPLFSAASTPAITILLCRFKSVIVLHHTPLHSD